MWARKLARAARLEIEPGAEEERTDEAARRRQRGTCRGGSMRHSRAHGKRGRYQYLSSALFTVSQK